MAIGTNDAIQKFGTESTVTVAGGTSSVANAAYSVAGDCVATSWANSDNALFGTATLKFQYPSGTITTGGIQLLARMLNTDSTNDEPVPSANWAGKFLGNFDTGTSIAAVTDAYLTIPSFSIPAMKAGQELEFYVKNSCGVTMTAGWTLKVTPKTVGPA